MAAVGQRFRFLFFISLPSTAFLLLSPRSTLESPLSSPSSSCPPSGVDFYSSGSSTGPRRMRVCSIEDDRCSILEDSAIKRDRENREARDEKAEAVNFYLTSRDSSLRERERELRLNRADITSGTLFQEEANFPNLSQTWTE